MRIFPAVVQLLLFSSRTATSFAPLSGGASRPITNNNAVSLDRISDEKISNFGWLDDGKVSNPERAVGIRENDRFQCDDSVHYWNNFKNAETVQDSITMLKDYALRVSKRGPAASDFALRHGVRTGYCLLNLAVGGVGVLFSDFVMKRTNPYGDDKKPFMKKLLSLTDYFFMVAIAGLCYEQDYERIAQGLYRKPWDMYTQNKQNHPINLLRKTASVAREVLDIYNRFSYGSEQDMSSRFLDTDKSQVYPEYYQNDFHYQSGGWMSEKSADLYEASTETLFRGCQDSTQRACLPEMVKHAKDIKSKDPSHKIQVLELACGTGRFMTFARDNLPLDSEYTATDLSPFYLEKVRENDEEWRRVRGKHESKSVTISPARILQANAEDVPLEDETFDVVFILNLLHEVPRCARANVAAEASRLCKPGGRVIVSDSASLGDFYDIGDDFTELNEPFYSDYIRDDISAHFERSGLQCDRKYLMFKTKTLTFRKPEK